MVRFKKHQLLAMGAAVGFGLFNPFSVAVLDEYFKLVYTALFGVCTLYLVGFLGAKVFKAEDVNIPAKTAKTKTSKFITT